MRRLFRLIFGIFKLLLFVLVIVLALVKFRYGGGAEFPDRTTVAEKDASALEVVVELDTPPGNIAVSEKGRVFISQHPEARPAISVVEIVNGAPQPFPSQEFNQADSADHFNNVLGIRLDRQNRLWVLDNGHHAIKPARLLAFDIDSRAIVFDLTFSKSNAGLGSHLNDLQVSADGRHIFIADASFFGKTPALLTVDTQTGKVRRLLENHPSVAAEHYTPVVQGRRMEVFGVLAIRPGVDSIALSRDGTWLYFAPITNNYMYRVRAADLLDTSLSSEALGKKVEQFALKTMSDGITTDAEGNIYLSDLEHSAIVRMNQDGTLKTLVQSPQLRWPDGFSFGPDGWLYVSCSALHQVFGKSPKQIAGAGPFQVFRINTGINTTAGH